MSVMSVVAWNIGGLFSPNSVATLRGSYGHSSGLVFNQGDRISVLHFPCNFLLKMASCEMSMCVSTAQARTKRGRPGIGVRHFPFAFHHKMAFVKCPCVFRLRKIAQNVGPGMGFQHFSSKLPHKMAYMNCPDVCSHVCAPLWAHMCALMILSPFPNSTQHTVWGLLPG